MRETTRERDNKRESDNERERERESEGERIRGERQQVSTCVEERERETH